MKTEQELVQEGRNQVLYLLLAIGDEYVAHDNWHPDKADFLLQTRREIVRRLEHFTPPRRYPNFATYTWTSG